MPQRLLYLVLLLAAASFTNAQYYIRGEVKDEKNQPLQNVRIVLQSSHQSYYSGSSGGFGITTKILVDSLIFSLEGYEAKTVKVVADEWQHINLKVLPSNVNRNRPKLISVTKDYKQSS